MYSVFRGFPDFHKEYREMPRKFSKFDRLTPVFVSKHCQCFERTNALRFADNAPESETRTAVRIRARGIVTRIRTRHTAIRIRVATGARQNKGITTRLPIIIRIMCGFTASHLRRNHVKKWTFFRCNIRYPTIRSSSVNISSRTVRICDFPYTIINFNTFHPFIDATEYTFQTKTANIF